MKMRCTPIVVSAIILCSTKASLGDVIFSNFGHGDAYNADQGYQVSEGVGSQSTGLR